MKWETYPYVFGDGRRVQAGGHCFELIPYVRSGTGGAVAGFALVVDRERHGFARFEGPIAAAIAAAERLIETKKTPRAGRAV
jgi:hypothetical protein